MFDDEVTIDTEHGNVTEHTQAKSCCKVHQLANLMVEPDQRVNATVVSTVDVSFGPTYVKEHTQPQWKWCNFEEGVLTWSDGTPAPPRK